MKHSPALYDNTTKTYDTSLHTVELIADQANTRFGWNWDGGATTWVTTQVPATSTALTLKYWIETVEAVAKASDRLWFEFESDAK